MTNEQAQIYLRGVTARLRTAIDHAQELMPEGVGREKIRQHIQPGCIGMLCQHADHFTEGYGDVLALSPLVELLDSLQEDVEILAKQGQPTSWHLPLLQSTSLCCHP